MGAIGAGGPLAFALLGQLRGRPPSRGALGLLVLGRGVELVLVFSGHHHLGHPGFMSGKSVSRIDGRVVPFLMAIE